MTGSSYLPAQTDAKILDITVGDLLREVAAAEPDRHALIACAPGRTPRIWTYRALLDDAERAAQWLLTKFRPGEHITVWAPNVPDWILLQYGAALAGLVLVTANPALRAGELEYVLRQSKSVGIAYSDSFRGTDMAAIADEVRGHVPEVREAIRFDTWYSDLPNCFGADQELPIVAPTAAAQLQYTSGTTGFPKGALLHHRGLITSAAYVHERAQFPRHGVWVTALPLFHTAACAMSVLGTAVSRGTIVVCQLFDPTLVLTALQEYRADLYAGVPAMMIALLAHPDFESFDLSSLSVAISGGDAVPPELVREVEQRFGARFSTVYGQTELSPIITQTSPDDTIDDKCGTVGRPLPNVEISVVAPGTTDPVAIGEQGEICARGYQAMLGYFDMPEQTAQTIDATGWLHTGDLGVLDERGYLRVTGRIKDMIIRGGENIYPREIEAVLTDHPAVAGAIVVGVPDAQWGEIVAAIIEPSDAANPPTAKELHDIVRSRLAPAKTPRDWYLSGQMPVNAMGKLQKFVLREQITAERLDRLPEK
ncbi:AMP-binding protein [Pseudonocardia abyssalis]|uniref:AMP-binding protein n=1 Tax=Pseudonocardia abyssalis TaxID=2792008 RepID=A0ABS6UXQ5_9PSEU|nr:AMP-binding protein [Pseudonocardia abyssalis]MBW0116652.1 AMP-binding protein [Pseudonocardia abyssalis]MBW0137058.1 AMP-binding protein [Pseudonocardia abyssalis]